MYLPLTAGLTMVAILLLMTIKIVPQTYQRIVILRLAKSSREQWGGPGADHAFN
jgi:hypothetical protein